MENLACADFCQKPLGHNFLFIVKRHESRESICQKTYYASDLERKNTLGRLKKSISN